MQPASNWQPELNINEYIDYEREMGVDRWVDRYIGRWMDRWRNAGRDGEECVAVKVGITPVDRNRQLSL